jgi:surface protein
VGADGNKAINQVTSGPVTIPATANGYSVVTIDTQAFYWCENITSVVIPNTVTRIEYGAFSNCTSIESITIPASVTYIDSYAFGRNTSLMSYSVDEANPRFTSKDGMLLNKAGNTLRAFPAGIEGEIVIPAYITDVSSGAFTGCSLSKLTFPENVIYVGSFAVTDCRNLQHVVWNASYQYINSCCFRYNGSLSNIELSEGLIFIGYEAFEGASMAEMVIPSSVTSIGGIAFSYCRSLERITLTTNVSTIEEQAFNHSANIKEIIIKEEGDGMLNSSINDNTFEEDVYQNATLYVPAGTSDFFKNANGWKKFQNIVEREGEPNSMPYIVWCKDNSTLYFLSSNTEVKKGGTYDGQTITDVWSGEDVTNTEQNEIVGQFSPPRFRWTTGECTRVVFDKSFETVRVRSTSDWFNSKLESIEGLEYLNTSEVTSMSYMFGGLKLSNLDLSHFDTHKVKYMHSMFEYCSGLTDLDLSHFDTRNVQSMAYMFSNCPNLKSIDLSSFDTRNVVNMSNMFRESTALTTLDLSSFNTSNVTTMRQMCYGCSNLTSIDMSSFDTGKVTDMWLMFSQCVALKTIYAGDGWSTVNVTDGSWMFGSCTSLVGGRGTVYDENNPHYTYAHIDGGSSNPGYFTDKNALEEDIEAAKQDLLNMIYACMEGRDYVQKNLSDKASESQAPELYQQMSEIDERLEHARYLLDKVTSMEELKDVQAIYCTGQRTISLSASCRPNSESCRDR